MVSASRKTLVGEVGPNAAASRILVMSSGRGCSPFRLPVASVRTMTLIVNIVELRWRSVRAGESSSRIKCVNWVPP